MANGFLTNGLLGMGGLGGGQSGMNSLLGDLYDPREMRKQQMKQMLLGMGVGLMSEKGMGRGAELALVAGNRAGDDYRQSALDAYRLKMSEEDRAYQRERDQRADAWQNTLMQWKMEDRQREEDQRAAADSAWNNLRTMPSTGIPVQNYGMADQLWQMGKEDQALGLVMPQQKPADLPNSYEEYLLSQKDPAFGEFMTNQKRAGASQNNVMGNIPPGYRVEYDEQGRPLQMVPIEGGPAAADAAKADSVAAAQQNKRMTMTDTVTNAADAARALVDWNSTGLVGQGLSMWGETDAAEVYRQTDVLKSTATIENLNAMRRESPTGGALGNVTEKEGQMLAAAAGALDPSSGPERFKQQLDNYELTLMRVIHGYAAGTQMFEQRKAMQDAGGQSGASAPPPGVDPSVWEYMTPEERQLWQR